MKAPIIETINKCIYSWYLPLQHSYFTKNHNGIIITKADRIHLPRYNKNLSEKYSSICLSPQILRA